MKLLLAISLLFSNKALHARFTCPNVPSDNQFGVYDEACEGNNIVFSFGTCPGELEYENEACSSYADDSSFTFCHQCSGRAVCSSSADKNAVCSDVSRNRCSSIDYEVGNYGCSSRSDYSGSYTVCKDGSTTVFDEDATDSCVNLFERQDINQCLACRNDLVICGTEGATCNNLPLPASSALLRNGNSVAVVTMLGVLGCFA